MRLRRRFPAGPVPATVPATVLAAALAAAVVGGVPALASATTEVEGVDCGQVSATSGPYNTDAPSLPLALMGVDEAHALLADGPGLPGAGQKVAVVDSGIHSGSGLLDVQQGLGASQGDPSYFHGTAVAGLVAGKPRDGRATGVAPGATVVDVRVYGDDPDGSVPGSAPEVDPARVVEGLRWVAARARSEGIGVAIVALRLDHSPALRDAVRAVQRQDVVVVAASGNRPQSEDDPLAPAYADGPTPDEDAADDVFPAGYDGVVAVSATAAGDPRVDEGADASGSVLLSSAVDVAAPTYGAVSLGVNGSTCVLRDVATSWAAAEVAGLVALLRARYDDESAEQVVARLVRTASGSPDDTNLLTGAGTVQPVEALTRPLTPDRTGRLGVAPVRPRDIPAAEAPPRVVDPAAAAREDALWWGLLAGGVLLLGLVGRPLLERRGLAQK
ncbi:S8 family serine peptidase [Nocardioides sp. GCM10027113]|uniref:S8 family serine peptidase n=1 Tax=unclassified Nocardioides TaxID=2615069 RepID=UPI00360A9CEF